MIGSDVVIDPQALIVIVCRRHPSDVQVASSNPTLAPALTCLFFVVLVQIAIHGCPEVFAFVSRSLKLARIVKTPVHEVSYHILRFIVESTVAHVGSHVANADLTQQQDEFKAVSKSWRAWSWTKTSPCLFLLAWML